MYRKELFRSLRNALNLSITSIVLVGCLSTQDSDSGFIEKDEPVRNSAPRISGSPTTAIIHGNSYMFRPIASDVDGDQLSFSINNKPPWARFDDATGELSGLPAVANVGTYANIEISVSDGQAKATLPRFAISVDQVGTLSTTLSWLPPTQNEDGTQLMDLAGYRIYWGTTPGQYTHSVTINSPGVSSYVVQNLSPGTYEFAGTSFNYDGVESAYSDPVTKVLN